MKYRKLGETDIAVSAVALGCWAIAGDDTWGQQDHSEALAAIGTALDVGINFFDTAEAYGGGRSEELLRAGLAGRRKEAIIASKYLGAHAAPEDLRASCENSLRRLGTDVIDLYQLHWPSREVSSAEQMETLLRLREEGKVREIGVCNCGVRDMADMCASGPVVSNQLPYNLLWRAIEFEIIDACAENGLAILPYSPLMQGLLTGKFRTADDVPEGRARTRHFSRDRIQMRHGEAGCEAETFGAIARISEISARAGESMGGVALAWLLAQRGVASVVAGARSPEQVRGNVRAAELSLSEDTLRELAGATEELKRTLGPNPDLWESPSRMR